MKEIQSLLKIVSDGLKTIAQSVEAISGKINETAKSESGEKPQVVKGRPAAPLKKVAKKTAKTPKKKAAKAPTAAETVFNIISRSKKGVDAATLMKKTGYDRKKVANMVYKLSKQGKIKSIQKGVYMKT